MCEALQVNFFRNKQNKTKQTKSAIILFLLYCLFNNNHSTNLLINAIPLNKHNERTTGLTTVAMAEEDSEEESIQAIMNCLESHDKNRGKSKARPTAAANSTKAKPTSQKGRQTKTPKRSLPVKWTASKVH